MTPPEMYQNPREFAWLLRQVYELKPEAILEVGSLFGGTLWHWMMAAQPGSIIVSVDLLVPQTDARFKQQQEAHQKTWRSWAGQLGHRLHVVEADSRAPETARVVGQLVPYVVDFLFIDGDHHYDSVKADFENYAPLVRPGGLVALHDIDIDETHPEWYGVRPFWAELKRQYRTEECIEQPGWWGIGVVHV